MIDNELKCAELRWFSPKGDTPRLQQQVVLWESSSPLTSSTYAWIDVSTVVQE